MNGLDLIVWGILVVVLTFVALKFIAPPCSNTTEAFQDSSPNTMKCPRGTKSFTNNDGNIQCCRGEVTGNRCEGKVACKISASADSIPFCKAGFQKKWDGDIPQFIKDIVKNMSLMNNFSYEKLINNFNSGYLYILSAGWKYKIDDDLINMCSINNEYNTIDKYAKKEINWYKQIVKDIESNKYSKAEIDEILEDFFAYLYFTFPSLYMPYITKLETCMQIKKMQPKK